MNKPAKVAFFFAHPTVPEYNKLLTMPFVLNILKLLDGADKSIDLYINEEGNENYHNFLSDKVVLKKLNYYQYNFLPHRIRHKLIVNVWNSKASIGVFPKYDLVFASGILGTILGGGLSEKQKIPLIYVNDEFPDVYQFDYLKTLEKRAIRTAAIIVSPDESRIEPLQRQVDGIQNIPTSILPNAPLKSAVENLPNIDWHKRLNIPPGKKLFLYVGNVLDMNQAPEIFSSLPDWPEEAVLMMKVKSLDSKMLRQYSHLIIKDKVYFTDEFLSEEEMNSLFQYATASLGLYRDVDDNFKFIGKSSGKIMSSLICGVPVIGSRCSSLDFVEKMGLGVLVDHPVEIADAVKEILSNYESFSANCKRTIDDWSYEHYWKLFAENLNKVTGLQIN